VQENNETFQLNIVHQSLPTDVVRGAINGQATITIEDDDCKLNYIDRSIAHIYCLYWTINRNCRILVVCFLYCM